MAHVRIPYGLRKDYHQVREQAVRDPVTGCLLVHPPKTTTNPNVYRFRGQVLILTRVVWAEERGDRGLEDHDVVHVGSCAHAQVKTALPNGHVVYGPVCIEPSHLILGDCFARLEAAVARGHRPGHPTKNRSHA